jgi:hypothetical protein
MCKTANIGKAAKASAASLLFIVAIVVLLTATGIAICINPFLHRFWKVCHRDNQRRRMHMGCEVTPD